MNVFRLEALFVNPCHLVADMKDVTLKSFLGGKIVYTDDYIRLTNPIKAYIKLLPISVRS
jgi:hypothetical protein